MNEVVVWADGRLRSADEPAVSVLDHGVTVGDGVFETCGVTAGKPFALTRHLDRLVRSARGLGLADPDLELVRDAVAEVLAAAPDAGRLRITVTAGRGPLGSGRNPGGRQTVLVVAGPSGPVTPAKVARVPWVRNERSAVAGLKTTSYAENVVALAEALRRGADEALLANTRGELCEGTGTNVFVEQDGVLRTPPLSSGCLAGITRELVLEWSAEADLPVREAGPGELGWEVLDDVANGRAHLLLTGSVRTAVPVVALDGIAVTTGPLSADVCALYARRAAAEVDP